MKEMPGLTERIEDEHEPCDRVSPPPIERGVEHQADQDSDGEHAVDEGDSALRLQHVIFERCVSASLPGGQAA